jgi:2-polyprenyl-3-methyl-5-hydroxy-6-metoxy-1,4-benzoquinol methylase
MKWRTRMIFEERKIQHGVVCVSPMPEPDFLQSYYREQYYQEGKGSYDVEYTEEEIEHKNYEAELIIQALVKQLGQKKIQEQNLLELGCGEGFVLNQAFKAGFQVAGVDYSSFGIKKFHPHLVDHFCEQDIYAFIEELSREKNFDVCILKNVLEHVISPEKLLNALSQILKSDGKLVITVPNDYSVLQKSLVDFNLVSHTEWFSPPDHLYYFNSENLGPYLEDFGFEILDRYCSFPVDMFLLNQHSNYHFDKSKGKQAHFSRVKMDLIIKKSGLDYALQLYRAMAQCGIGRNTTVIVKKK